MLKITSIITSLVFLLFLGTGSYAHTLMQENQQKTACDEDKKDDSTEKDDIDDEHRTVPQIDLFQAFSLVTI